MTTVQYITFRDVKYPVRLSYRVFKGLKQDLGKFDIRSLESLDPDIMEGMLWHGLVNGHRVTGQEMKFKRIDMEEVLDECMMEFLNIVPLFFPKKEEGKQNPDLSQQPEKGA